MVIAASIAANAAQQQREAIHEAAARLALTAVRGGYRGIVEGAELELEAQQVFLVAWTGRQPIEAAILSKKLRSPSGGKIETGDRDFDDCFHLLGDRVLALAWLDAEVRASLVQVANGGPVLRVVQGRVAFAAPGLDEGHLEWLAKLAASLAVRFSITLAEIAPKLARVATRDPCEGVRRRALEDLVLRFQPNDITRDAAEMLLEDPAEEIAIMAAVERGYPRALDRALTAKDAELRAFAASFIEARGAVASSDAIGEALRTVPAEEVTAKLFAALSRNDDAEAALIPLLEVRKLREQVMLVLAEKGDRAALEALAPYARSFLSGTRDAANAAIAAIRERLRLPENLGALSLSPERGELSVAEQEGGELSKSDRW